MPWRTISAPTATISRRFLRAMFPQRGILFRHGDAQQIKSPVQWLVGTVRLLQRDHAAADRARREMIKNLGQELLAPPNVKGWDGGLSWITTNTLLARYNQAAILVMGQGNLGARTATGPASNGSPSAPTTWPRDLRPADVEQNYQRQTTARDDEAVIAALEKRFLQGRLTEKHRQVLRDYLEPRTDLDDQDIRHAIRLLMSTPEYQVT